jgi:hypothetical protein
MHRVLKIGPDSRCLAVRQVEVEAVRSQRGALMLRYTVSGDIGNLALPRVVEPARTDELWRHTCFEAFVRPAPGEAYYEFNFAPSTQWAAYRFERYREEMRMAEGIGAPRTEVDCTPERFALQAALQLDRLLSGRWALGLAAVIEDKSGRLSYWALAHGPGKPDFHCADCFTCEI